MEKRDAPGRVHAVMERGENGSRNSTPEAALGCFKARICFDFSRTLGLVSRRLCLLFRSLAGGG